MAWLLVRPLLFAIVTYRTLAVVELGVARYLSGVWHPIAGSIAMIAVVMTVNASLSGMAPWSRLLIGSFVGCVVYSIYNVLFNFAALQDVRSALSLRSPRLAAPGGPLRRTETHAI
jgi:hypothetical protein